MAACRGESPLPLGARVAITAGHLGLPNPRPRTPHPPMSAHVAAFSPSLDGRPLLRLSKAPSPHYRPASPDSGRDWIWSGTARSIRPSRSWPTPKMGGGEPCSYGFECEFTPEGKKPVLVNDLLGVPGEVRSISARLPSETRLAWRKTHRENHYPPELQPLADWLEHALGAQANESPHRRSCLHRPGRPRPAGLRGEVPRRRAMVRLVQTLPRVA